jgi:hypothetical protein
MLTPNFEETQHLTQDEEILHHYVAVIKKNLEAVTGYACAISDTNQLTNKSQGASPKTQL